MKGFGLVIGLISIAVFAVMKLVAFRFIPADFHPLAWSATFTGLFWTLVYLLTSDHDDSALHVAFFAAAMGWLGLAMAIMDKTCPAGFAGFTSIAVFCTVAFTYALENTLNSTFTGWEIAEKLMLAAGTFFMTAAVLFYAYMPA